MLSKTQKGWVNVLKYSSYQNVKMMEVIIVISYLLIQCMSSQFDEKKRK